MYLLVGCFLVVGCFGDTPANCTIEDVVGEWVFYEGKISKNPDLDCTQIREFSN